MDFVQLLLNLSISSIRRYLKYGSKIGIELINWMRYQSGSCVSENEIEQMSSLIFISGGYGNGMQIKMKTNQSEFVIGRKRFHLIIGSNDSGEFLKIRESNHRGSNMVVVPLEEINTFMNELHSLLDRTSSLSVCSSPVRGVGGILQDSMDIYASLVRQSDQATGISQGNLTHEI